MKENFYTPSIYDWAPSLQLIDLITPFLDSGSPLTLCTATYLRHLFVFLVNHTGDLHKHLILCSNCANGSAGKAHFPPSRSHKFHILILVLLEVLLERNNTLIKDQDVTFITLVPTYLYRPFVCVLVSISCPIQLMAFAF